MADETEAIRAIVSRSFALLAASVHAIDPNDQLEIAERYEEWIMTGDCDAFTADPKAEEMVIRFCQQAAINNRGKSK